MGPVGDFLASRLFFWVYDSNKSKFVKNSVMVFSGLKNPEGN